MGNQELWFAYFAKCMSYFNKNVRNIIQFNDTYFNGLRQGIRETPEDQGACSQEAISFHPFTSSPLETNWQSNSLGTFWRN